MKQIICLILLLHSYSSLFSQTKDRNYYIGIADSIVLSQCSEDFYELLNKNKDYYFKRRFDITDPKIDLKKADKKNYYKKFEKDFHIISYGTLKVHNKLINIKKGDGHICSSNLQLIFIEDSLTESYGSIPDFKILEFAYKRLLESHMISEDSAKKVLEPLLTLTPHLETIYSICYDVDMNQVIWIATRTKQAVDGKNRLGGRAYLTKKGNSIEESIELNAETGEILKHETEECKVIIR